MSRGVTEQHVDVEYHALHDGLTGLPNRALLRDRAQQARFIAARGEEGFALAVLNIDHFKGINETLGRFAGDTILREMAQRLINTLRHSDTVARLSGDEFALVLPGMNRERAIAVAQKILTAIHLPFSVDNQVLRIGASLGIALFPEHDKTFKGLLRKADLAMYRARRTRAGFSLYEAARDTESRTQFALTQELREAIKRRELVLYYQPKIDLRTGHIEQAEALLRWPHAVRGMMLPEEFVPIAEKASLIASLTLWAIKEALLQVNRWQEAGVSVAVAINLSAHSLLDESFPNKVANALRETGAAPERLVLELTESAIVSDPGCAKRIFSALGAMGVRLSIDDFGTGYSSLAHLKKLPVAEIKIDKSFVMDLQHDDNNAGIVHGIIALAHNLGISTIAEGADSAETLELLEALGCDMAQGNYISPPVPAAEFIEVRQGLLDKARTPIA